MVKCCFDVKDTICFLFRLPENFLTKAFEFSIKQPWRIQLEAEQSSRSDLEEKFRVGYVCEAIWPGDDLWYAAKIVRVKSWKERSDLACKVAFY